MTGSMKRLGITALLSLTALSESCRCDSGKKGHGLGRDQSWGEVRLKRVALLKRKENADVQWPKSVRISPDGKTAYVENLAGMNTMVVDTKTYQVKKYIPHLGRPCEADFTKGGALLWVSYLAQVGPQFPEYINEWKKGAEDYKFPSVVAVIDTKKNEIVRKVEVGVRPKVVQASGDGRWVLASNYSSGLLSAIRQDNYEVKTLPIGRQPRGIAITPDGKRAYVALMAESALARVNLDTLEIDGRIENVGRRPRHLKFTRDGRWLYGTLNGEASLIKIDAKTEQVIARVKVGREPRTFVFSPDEKRIYVVTYRDDKVVVVDTENMKVIGKARAEKWPVGCDITPDGKHLWVSNYRDHSVIVYEIPQ